MSLVDLHAQLPSGPVPACSAALLKRQVAAGGSLPLFPPAFHGPRWPFLRGLLLSGAAAAGPVHT